MQCRETGVDLDERVSLCAPDEGDVQGVPSSPNGTNSSLSAKQPAVLAALHRLADKFAARVAALFATPPVDRSQCWSANIKEGSVMVCAK